MEGEGALEGVWLGSAWGVGVLLVGKDQAGEELNIRIIVRLDFDLWIE